MNKQELLACFHEAVADPRKLMDKYLAEGRKVVLTAPVYTPEEIIHSMGMVPAFICTIMQSIVELGIKGVYDGASAIVIPSLCDSLKVIGQNWKYAVKGIPFIAMTYPQNRKPAFGHTFTKAGYEYVIRGLEEATGLKFDDEKLAESIEVYNAHNAAMRALVPALAAHSEITCAQRSDIFKSAFFMRKEEHTALVNELLAVLEAEAPAEDKIRIMTSGILADAPGLLEILDDNGMQIVCDDVAAESRQYRTDAPAEGETALDRLASKFCAGVLVVLTKFCDPEEFDYPLIKRACAEAEIPCVLIEVDRQMVNYEQARTAIETFKDLL